MSSQPPEHDADTNAETDDKEQEEKPEGAILYPLSTLRLEPVVSTYLGYPVSYLVSTFVGMTRGPYVQNVHSFSGVGVLASSSAWTAMEKRRQNPASGMLLPIWFVL